METLKVIFYIRVAALLHSCVKNSEHCRYQMSTCFTEGSTGSTSSEGSGDLSALQSKGSGQYLGQLLVAPLSSKSYEAVRFLRHRCWTKRQSSEFDEHQNHMRSSKTGKLHSRKLFEPFRFVSRSALKLPEGIHEKVWQRVHLKTLRSFLGHIGSPLRRP